MRMLELLESRRLLSGVTLITHGQGGGGDDEAEQLGNLIADRAGGAAQYVMTVEADNVLGAQVTRFERRANSSDLADVASGEQIIFKIEHGIDPRALKVTLDLLEFFQTHRIRIEYYRTRAQKVLREDFTGL